MSIGFKLMEKLKRVKETGLCIAILVMMLVAAIPANAEKNSFVGKTAPDFILEDIISGKKVRLSSYKGKKAVVLNFWKSR